MFQLTISDTSRTYQSLMGDVGDGRVAMDGGFSAGKAWKATDHNVHIHSDHTYQINLPDFLAVSWLW